MTRVSSVKSPSSSSSYRFRTAGLDSIIGRPRSIGVPAGSADQAAGRGWASSFIDNSAPTARPWG